MNFLDTAEELRLFREIDIRNAECRARWTFKLHTLTGKGYADLREAGGVMDEHLATQRRTARHRLNRLLADKARKAEQPNNVVSIFHRPQAG